MAHSFMFERFSAAGTDHLLQAVNINYSYAVGILIVLWITLFFTSFKNPFKSSESIKLNCWYCNHDSYITLGKRETQEYWLCAFCGSENARSQSGEVIDPPPLVPENKLQRFANFIEENPTPNKSKYSLCNDCQEKQLLKLNLLRDYIPDENDPEYKKKCKTAAAFKESLDKQYEICESCQKMLQQLKAEDASLFMSKRLELLLEDNKRYGVPITISTNYHLRKGFLWLAVHLGTILYLIYACYYPPSTSNFTLVKELCNKAFNFLTACLQTPDKEEIVVKLMSAFETYTKSLFERAIKCIAHAICCLNKTDTTNGECDADIKEFFIEALVINILSYKLIHWHPLLRKAYNKVNRFHHWRSYLIVQHVLFYCRFVILLYLRFPAVWLSFYVLALAYSTFKVRIKGKYLALTPRTL
ncbi:hypothetical protein G6F70_002479 [Rhizopus microsporus]|nr:hypothetical protein G6F71_002576 [Rhizopus microsporus]KAG1202172.1 hypothetical protein G6F70_002479 [Rhizopus microsporus]KAG1216242.1 hypothetical protein G6F69_000297 [Rhizopus microsporus]KAG1268158.1 hypothetical protein G6F68_001331 [Rhizopus microsporus]